MTLEAWLFTLPGVVAVERDDRARRITLTVKEDALAQASEILDRLGCEKDGYRLDCQTLGVQSTPSASARDSR